MKRHMLATLFAIASLFASAAAPVTIGENETKYLATSDYGNAMEGTIIVAESGATLSFPETTEGKDVAFYPHLVVSGGVVRVTFPEGSKYGRLRFVSGIRAVEGGSLVVEGFKQVSVDRETVNTSKMLMPSTGPLCDIGDITFTASGASGLLLRLKSTVRKLPSTCNVSIEKDATIALACDTDADSAPIRDGNSFAVDKFDVIALTANALPDGCHVRVSPGRSFSFKPAALAADGLSYTPQTAPTGRFDIELLGVGATVKFANANSQSVRCLSNVRGKGEVQFKPEGTTTPFTRFRGVTYRAAASTALVIPVDDDAYPVAATTDAWRQKVSHWFDASDADTIVPFTFNPNTAFGWSGAKNEFNGHQIVIGWKDKVEGSSFSLYNQRIWNKFSSGMNTDYVLQVMPYAVENGLNGKTYLCCGTRGGTADNAKYDSSGKLTSVGEARRLRVWDASLPDTSGLSKPDGNYSYFKAAYCIMVFGSQQGGGRAILGTGTGTTQLGSDLVRAGYTKDNPWVKSSGYKMHVDGNYANSSSNTPNGEWQIVSVDLSGKDTFVTGIGNEAYNDSNCGGQNYAEVIFFDEKPTVEERTACERYLAEKWGVFCTQWNVPGAMAHGSAGTVFLGNRTESGYTETDDECEEIQAIGVYSGSGKIDIPEGRTLLLDRPLPPTEADVPETNRVGWYDPDFEGSVKYGYDKADLLDILYERTVDGVLTNSTDYMFSSGTRDPGNFAPRVVAGVRGALTTDPSRNWMVFDKSYNNDGVGNMLRRRKVGDGANGNLKTVSIQQGFFVTDTADGGGDIFGQNATFATGNIKPRNGTDVNDPIWTPSNTVTMVSTWLNTDLVDGTTHGYSGRPEVLSFAAQSAFDMGSIANWLGANTEIVGEFILYSEPLEDAARTKVQEYLMYKWFGNLNNKYADFTGATVQGAGTVKSPTLRNLPKFGDNFTGPLAGGSRLEFTLGADGVADALAIGRELALEDGATVTVNVSGKPAAGHYTLLTAKAISGSATLDVNGLPEGRRAVLHVETSEIWLEILSPGLMIIVR